MILLHGLLGQLSNWTPVAEYFDATYNVHVPLLPLFDQHNETHLEYLVHWLEVYINTNNLNNIILIGNSLGGHIATIYAHKNSEKVNAVILTGSSGLYEKSTLGTYPKRRSYSYIRERVAYTFYSPEIATVQLVDDVFQTIGDNKRCLSIIKTSKATQRDKVTALLPQIKLPVLLIWGKEDQITPPKVAEEFYELLPDANLIYFEKCGHAPMMERPNDFNVAVEKFLNKVLI